MKNNIILDPSISHEDLFARALAADQKTRLQILRQLDLYRAIHSSLGKIQRPDYENDSPRIIRAKYVPAEKHDKFFRAGNTKKGRSGRWLMGGNRSGKTESGIREDIAYSIGFRPWYKRDDPDFRVKSFTGSSIGRIFFEDWKKSAKEIIVPKIYSVLPNELLKKVSKNEQGVEDKFEIKVPFDATGRTSVITLVGNKADVRSLEGWDGDWLHFDEPTRNNIFVASTRGLVDRQGTFWLTATLLSEPWVLDDIVNNPEYIGFYIHGYDNVFDPKTGAGGVTKEGLDAYYAKIKDPAERETRMTGKPKHLSGSVFKSFDPGMHVYPNDKIKMEKIPDTWWRDCFIDPGRRKPHCVVFVAWSPSGEMFVYDGFRIGDPNFAEDFPDVIPAVPSTATELISEIKKRCVPWPQRFFIDPMAETPDLGSGTTLFDHLSVDFSIDLWPKFEKELQISALQELVKPDDVTGRPRFYIHHMLTRAIYEMERYRWDEYATSSVRKYKPKVIKEDDDYVDCMIAAALCPPMEIDESIPEPQPYFRY